VRTSTPSKKTRKVYVIHTGIHTCVLCNFTILNAPSRNKKYTFCTTGRPGFDPRQRQTILPLASVCRPALKPTQPPINWVPGVLSPGVNSGHIVTLTTQIQIQIQKFKFTPFSAEVKNEELYSSPPWCQYGVAGQLYFTLTSRNFWSVYSMYPKQNGSISNIK
jgi:hypothetical protein